MGTVSVKHLPTIHIFRSSMRTVTLTSVALAAGASAQFRELAGHLSESYFFGYGCWCNFDGDKNNLPGTGRGKPVDEWDEACKNLVDGYECAVKDFEDCEPWNERFDAPGMGFERNIKDYCTKMTDNKCARAACILETTFINIVGETVIRNQSAGTADLSSLDAAFYHEHADQSPNFDQKTCETIRGPPAEKKCCGDDYPSRFPYKFEHRECCASTGTTVPIGHLC